VDGVPASEVVVESGAKQIGGDVDLALVGVHIDLFLAEVDIEIFGFDGEILCHHELAAAANRIAEVLGRAEALVVIKFELGESGAARHVQHETVEPVAEPRAGRADPFDLDGFQVDQIVQEIACFGISLFAGGERNVRFDAEQEAAHFPVEAGLRAGEGRVEIELTVVAAAVEFHGLDFAGEVAAVRADIKSGPSAGRGHRFVHRRGGKVGGEGWAGEQRCGAGKKGDFHLHLQSKRDGGCL